MASTLRGLLRPLYRLLTYSPFALLREQRAFHRALNDWKGRHVFIFSYLSTGGAERVHADIMATVTEAHPLIVITGFSKDRGMAVRFAAQGLLLEVPRLIHHPLTARSTKHLLAARINAVERPVFFGSNTDHFFGLLPALKPATKAIHLVHAFLYQPHGNRKFKAWTRWFDRVDHFVFVSGRAKAEFEIFLGARHFPETFRERLVLIPNAVRLVGSVRPHDRVGLLFVGRDSPEKRLPLFLAIARRVMQQAPGRFHVTVVGPPADRSVADVVFTGPIVDQDRLAQVYADHDVLLLTSSREGLPLVIMEAMAGGLAVMATPVGDIPDLVAPAFGVVASATDEQRVKDELTDALIALVHDPEGLLRMREAALATARSRFDGTAFQERYRSLLMSPSSSA